MGKLSLKGKKNAVDDSQKKISSYFKKKDDKLFTEISPVNFDVKKSSIVEEDKTLCFQPVTLKNLSTASKEISSSLEDSDIEIIEGTPQEKCTKCYVAKSPEFIPPTPVASEEIAQPLGEKSYCNPNNILFKFKDKLRKKNNDATLTNQTPSYFNSISFKRVAESKTGISPDAKRVDNRSSFKSPSPLKINCKTNLFKNVEQIKVKCLSNSFNELSSSIPQNGLSESVKVGKSIATGLSQEFEDSCKVTREIDESNCQIGPKSKEKVSSKCEEISDDILNDLFDESFEDRSESNSNKLSKSDHDKVNTIDRDEPILSPTSFCVKGNYGRHIVLSAERDPYERELRLTLKSLSDGMLKTCTLSGFWYESIIKEKDILNVLNTTEENGHFKISNEEGIVVINPDLLISGTSVVSGVFCKRKAILNERFKGYDSSNRIMIVGTLVHQLFQEALRMKISNTETLKDIADCLLQQRRILQDLYAIKLESEEIKEDIKHFIPYIISWSNKYLNREKVSSSKHDNIESWNGCISSILDIEENIWSPKYGIKGKIDLTVEVKTAGRTKVMPLELKTGKSSFSSEHRGQVILYSMMASDKREDPQGGLLLYLKDGSMAEVTAGEKEKKGLIQLRNELALYLHLKKDIANIQSLPEHLNSQRICLRCPQQLPCSLFLNHETTTTTTTETTQVANSAMASILTETLSHLSEKDFDFFRRWCMMLQCEAAHVSELSKNHSLWCMDAQTREDAGDCLAEVVLKPNQQTGPDGQQHMVHCFQRRSSFKSPYLTENFQAGDFVVLSSDKEIALTQGTVISSSNESLEILLDRNLKNRRPHDQQTVYRIDRLTSQATMAINYTNLAYLLAKSPRAARLRQLIIGREQPCYSQGVSMSDIQALRPIFRRMNHQQIRAVTRAIRTKDYSILKGFPGTGKTATVVNLIEILWQLGKSILLTSNTHSAVDNILLKLKENADIKFLRLGRVSRIHKDLHSFSDEELTKDAKSTKELAYIYNNARCVATTCLGIGHPLFLQRTFDYCIMDEASQVLQLAAVGPLLYCKQFVLVGDPLQLPPVIQSHSARSLGMSESLLELLDIEDSTVCLVEQYRMNEPIMEVANKLMYNGQLKCGSEEQKASTIKLNYNTDDKELSGLMEKFNFVKRVVSGKLEDSVLFLDTGDSCPDSKVNSVPFVNVGESQLIQTIIDALIKCEVPLQSIGIIAPFRAQVKHLKSVLPSDHIEVNTVDQYQGRDKDVIVYSCVRSDRSTHFKARENEILMDLRRLNVATTRAKRKLIIIGDRVTLRHYSPFSKLFDVLNDNQICIIN